MSYQFQSNGTYYKDDYDDEAYDYDDEAYYDDESTNYYDESYDNDYLEKTPKGKPKPKNASGAKGKAMQGSKPKGYKGQATMNTPAGQAKVNLPPDLVSKKEFKELEAKVLANNKAILTNGKAIDVLNENDKKLEQSLSKNAADTQKKFKDIQQAQMMSALIPPTLTSFTPEGAGAVETKVAKSSFDSTGALLPALLSGGMGGGNSGSNDMMMPLMIMAMQGGIGSSGSDNSMLFMVMAMMMNNK